MEVYMKFKSENLIKNLKLISIGDFCYLDVPNNFIYFADDKSAIRIRTVFEDVKDEKLFVISRADFLHIISFSNEIELKSNYTYKAGSAKGKIEHNSNFDSVLESITVHFDQSDSYEQICTINNSILTAFSRAGIFVSDNSNKEMEKYLNIKNGYIFSSSNYRIYKNTFSEFEKESLFSFELLKFIHIMGEGTVVKKNETSYFLEGKDLSVYLTFKNRVDFLPLFEQRISEKIASVFNTIKIELNTKEFLKALSFINFYTKSHPSNLALLTIGEKSLTLSSVTNNSIDVDCEVVERIEKVENKGKIAFNSISLQNIVSKLGDTEKFTIYVSEDDENKLFILKFSENENVILTKINLS